ncbi:formyltetrahydrofolate deformylase [Ilyomonas limi]|uniref:Formyltetrahydrofolate deformylase n=1 Tax=Ilyomonas limi TaxID=2575867 RepID=A0A4U3LCD0_9BACT|nr:formyltetrahydrofolate deformylase [Ilyomonas limi]TKK71517.1 formyltetrahydrofolate deformylase [Ilyomonas limi]
MVIVIQCKDKVGLVASITTVLMRKDINIISMREFVNTEEVRFFVRIETTESSDVALIEAELQAVLPNDAAITINPLPDKKIVVLVTKEYHCLSDILIRNYFSTLGATVQCVIGNHAILEELCNKFNVPFYYISHEGNSKEAFEEKLISTIRQYQSDYLVLAKFMRILSPQFVALFAGRIINIHHSFLPAFIGAHPYRQAYERGVKMIGATAHFVTNDLDEGPIIVQQIIPVNHAFTAADMIKAGREIETAVLAKALQLVLDDRVFVYKNKTVVFE